MDGLIHWCAGTAPDRVARCFNPAMAERFEAAESVEIDAPPERVWQALVDPDLVARYMHGTSVETDWNVGAPIVWRGEWQGRRYEDKGEVLAFDPPRRLAVTHWSPLTGDPDVPDNYHHVTYDIEPLDGNRSRLTLTHGNSPSQEAAEAMIENGWRPMLQSLRAVAEEAADKEPPVPPA
jgi:uncharacterized protein YndB with AHSA1/START domain